MAKKENSKVEPAQDDGDWKSAWQGGLDDLSPADTGDQPKSRDSKSKVKADRPEPTQLPAEQQQQKKQSSEQQAQQ